MFPVKRVVIAVALGLWLCFLLPATAEGFFELYHATHFEPFYWMYGGLKAGGYYFSQWPYREVACAGAALLVLTIPMLWQRKKEA